MKALVEAANDGRIHTRAELAFPTFRPGPVQEWDAAEGAKERERERAKRLAAELALQAEAAALQERIAAAAAAAAAQPTLAQEAAAEEAAGITGKGVIDSSMGQLMRLL